MFHRNNIQLTTLHVRKYSTLLCWTVQCRCDHIISCDVHVLSIFSRFKIKLVEKSVRFEKKNCIKCSRLEVLWAYNGIMCKSSQENFWIATTQRFCRHHKSNIHPNRIKTSKLFADFVEFQILTIIVCVCLRELFVTLSLYQFIGLH